MATSKFPLSKIDKLDQLKVPEQVTELTQLIADGTTFAEALPAPDKLIKPLSLSGKEQLEGQQGKVGYVLGGSAEAKLAISAFNDPADVDPDQVITPGSGTAWLKYDLGAALKGNVKGSVAGTDLDFGLEAELGARLLQYRAHQPSDEVGLSLVNDVASYRFPVRLKDVQGLGADDALAYLVGGRLAFSAKLTWADAFTGTLSALDQALGVSGVSAIDVKAGASFAFDVAASDDYRLVFRHGSGSGSTRVEVKKTRGSRVGLTAGLEVEAELANPKALAQAVETYLESRLGVSWKQIEAVLGKIDSALTLQDLPANLRPVATEIGKRLGLTNLQTEFGELKSRIENVHKRLSDKLLAALKTKVQFSFQASYTRVSSGEAVLVCELDAAALTKHHGQLLKGNLAGVLNGLAAGESGYTLVEFLKTRTLETKLSFGITLSLGTWSAFGRSVKTKRWEIQTNVENRERASFDGWKKYQDKWGEEEYENAFELQASMNGFSTGAHATASEFEYGLSLSWMWKGNLTLALLADAFDLGNLWGAFGEDRNEALTGQVRQKASGKVEIDVQLDVADEAVRFFFELADDEAKKVLKESWADALAAGLPRVHVGNTDVFRNGVGLRRAVYGDAAEWILGQPGGFDIVAAVGRVQYGAAGLGTNDRNLLESIDLGESSQTAAPFFAKSLRALWTQASSGSRPLGRFQRAAKTILQFEKAVRTGGGKKVVADTFDRIQKLLSMPYYFRVLGCVFANLADRSGQDDLVTATLKVTDKDGNAVLVA